MKKIESITIKRIIDYDTDLSYLGKFSDEKGKFAVHNTDEPGKYKYFNAENVENMKQAKENYNRVMKYDSGELCDYGVRAEAEIRTSHDGQNWLINKVTSGGLWGISSDAEEYEFKAEGGNQLDELSDLLSELGFSSEEINEAKQKAIFE